MLRSLRLIGAGAISVSAVALTVVSPSAAAAEVCAADDSADSLNAVFDSAVDGFVGGDYQRVHHLDDGRSLWTFQDVYVATGSGERELLHNAALIEENGCFELLQGGTSAAPTPWVGGAETDEFETWFWPLDGYQASDDTFVLYLAEMHEHGDRYLTHTMPTATWTTTIDLTTMEPGPLEPAPDPSGDLYGFEIVTDDEFVYLYAQCHRQFGFSELGLDECGNDVTIARHPHGNDDAIEYFDGDGWDGDGDGAASVAPPLRSDEYEFSHPMQVEPLGNRWISVTKVSDWWGDTIKLATAPAPEGPWVTTSIVPTATWGPSDEFSAYFTSIVDSDRANRTVTLATSNNRWDGSYSDAYRPTFDEVSTLLWWPRHAEQIRTDLWLPRGELIR